MLNFATVRAATPFDKIHPTLAVEVGISFRAKSGEHVKVILSEGIAQAGLVVIFDHFSEEDEVFLVHGVYCRDFVKDVKGLISRFQPSGRILLRFFHAELIDVDSVNLFGESAKEKSAVAKIRIANDADKFCGEPIALAADDVSDVLFVVVAHVINVSAGPKTARDFFKKNAYLFSGILMFFLDIFAVLR